MAPNRKKIATSTLGLIFELAQKLLTDPKNTWVVGVCLFFAELVINTFIIRRVPYTEIDWTTYMQQVTLYENGERDYAKIGGSTGPLVYPALHVYIYSILKSLCTPGGENIVRAQWIFMGLYLANLLIVLEIYKKLAKIQPWKLCFMFLASHRIHSLYVLRLFNDPIAMIFLHACILAMVKRQWILSTIMFTLALNVKMNILLFAPGFAYVFWREHGLVKSAGYSLITGLGSIFIGMPFLLGNWESYMAGAFNFSRKFEFKWTVNWRFLTEEVFLAKEFHAVLLGLHLTMLAYLALQKWWKVTKLTPTDMVLVMFSSNFVGMCFSRSLHYQFLTWYHHTLPALVFLPGVLSTKSALLVLGCIELCWNTYPSTNWSSALLHVCHSVILGSLVTYKWKIDDVSKKDE